MPSGQAPAKAQHALAPSRVPCFILAGWLCALGVGCKTQARAPTEEEPAATAAPEKLDTSQSEKSPSTTRRELLHAAALGDLAAVEELLDAGADPNARAMDPRGRTALILAALGGHADVVDALLAKGAGVDERDRGGLTALCWAAMRGRTQVAKRLLSKGADVNALDNGGASPLLYAVGTHNADMVDILFKHEADLEVESRGNMMTPLLLAIEHHDVEIIGLLLENGADVNHANQDRVSPLIAAAQKGQVDVAEMLLSRGANRGWKDKNNATALKIAKRNGHKAVVALLKRPE